MSFLANRVTLETFSPDLTNPIIFPQTTIAGSGVEFENVDDFDIPSDNSNVVNADFDLEADTIRYTIEDMRFSAFADVEAFNGYVLSDTDKTLPPIIGISIPGDSNTLGLPVDQVFFNDDTVYVDVDALRFSNGDGVILDVEFGVEEEVSATEDALYVARLYTATFGRNPDEEGLNFWIDAQPLIGSREALAGAFANSPEFEDRFGGLDALTEEDYVRQLYRNVLGREGEDAGVEFWTNAIQGGFVDEAGALAAFAVSPENVANTESFESIAFNIGTEEWSILAPL